MTFTSSSVSWPPEMSLSVTWPTPFTYHFSPTIPGSSGVHSPVTIASVQVPGRDLRAHALEQDDEPVLGLARELLLRKRLADRRGRPA